MPPGLYLVATPIGNLGDITFRAVDVLRRSDLILAEDTRVSGKLLKHLGVTAPMRSFHEHNEAALEAEMLARLGREVVALVSDAGTPLVADPGFRLVRAARAAGLRVEAWPGRCAAIAALTVSGLPTDRFLFAGFLPSRAAARAAAIAKVAAIPASLVFYETAPRLAAALAALADGLGDRPASVSRELTKLHEETVAGHLGELAARFAAAPVRGEIVIVIGPPLPPAPPALSELDAALDTLPADASLKDAAAEIATRLGLPRRAVYQRALARRLPPE